MFFSFCFNGILVCPTTVLWFVPAPVPHAFSFGMFCDPMGNPAMGAGIAVRGVGESKYATSFEEMKFLPGLKITPMWKNVLLKIAYGVLYL